MLGMYTLAYAGFWVTNRLASSGPMTIGEACIRFLGCLRYGVVTATVICGTLVGVAAALTAREDITVAKLVSNLDEAMPLSGNGFANLIMRDEYLWAQTASRTGAPDGLAQKASPRSLVAALRDPMDRFSTVIPEAVMTAYDAGIDFGSGFELADDGSGWIVTYVHPETPAGQAGVRRGWRLLEVAPGGVVDASASTISSAHLFQDEAGEQRRLVLPSSWGRVSMVNSRVSEVEGKRIGYLFLRNFSEVAKDDLRKSFAEFKSTEIDELILDLRYNPGGRVSISVLVASLIAGDRVDGKVFQREFYNEKYADLNGTQVFSSQPESLSLTRVFVLTTADTCSASEAVINGLAPYLEVVTIGGRTCGKPIGSVSKSFQGLTYAVISFRLENSRGEGGYFNGISPTCDVAENFRAELGGAGDPLVDAALGYMRDARCPEPGSARHAVTG